MGADFLHIFICGINSVSILTVNNIMVIDNNVYCDASSLIKTLSLTDESGVGCQAGLIVIVETAGDGVRGHLTVCVEISQP